MFFAVGVLAAASYSACSPSLSPDERATGKADDGPPKQRAARTDLTEPKPLQSTRLAGAITPRGTGALYSRAGQVERPPSETVTDNRLRWPSPGRSPDLTLNHLLFPSVFCFSRIWLWEGQ